MIRENYLKIRERAEQACRKSIYGKEVTLVAVSKMHTVSEIREVYDMGHRDFGENKVQELLEKIDKLPGDIRWHLIGHLQTNKVKYIIDKVYMIHSVDSLKLLNEINKEAEKHGIVMPVLIEVNIADEESKYGIKAAECEDLLRQASVLKNVSVKGLMCIPPAADDREESRMYFDKLRNLSIDISALNIDNISVNILSMGMSNDFETAIDAGSDIIRVGTSIFGKRNYIN